MKRLPEILAVIAVALTVAVVFSPLAATLTGTSAHSSAEAFHGLGPTLAGSTATALASALVALLLGVPFAILVERSGQRTRGICSALGLAVLMVPPYIVAESSIVLFGPAGKISRPVAALLGFGPHSTDPFVIARFVVPGFVYSRAAVGIVMGGCLFPIVALAVASAFRRTDLRVFESARLAQGRRGVLQIAAHVLVPPALGAALLVFAVTLTEFAVPQLLRVRTIGEAVYEQIQEGELATAAALGLPLLPIVVAAGALGAYILARARIASLGVLEGEVPKYTDRDVGLKANLPAAIMTVIAVIPGLVVPFTSLTWLVSAAKLPPTSAIGTHKLLRAAGFMPSLRGAWELAHDDAIRTILLAGFGATLATAFAIILVRLTSRMRWRPVLGILGAGLAVPAALVGLGPNHPLGPRLEHRHLPGARGRFCSRGLPAFCPSPSFSPRAPSLASHANWKAPPLWRAGGPSSGSFPLCCRMPHRASSPRGSPCMFSPPRSSAPRFSSRRRAVPCSRHRS